MRKARATVAILLVLAAGGLVYFERRPAQIAAV